MNQRMSLRSRFVLFCLACLVPISIAVSYFVVRSTDRSAEQLTSNQTTIASMADQSVSSFFERNIVTLESLAQTSPIMSMDAEQADIVLGATSAVRSEISGLFLIDANGVMVRPPATGNVDYLVGLGEQFEATMANQQVMISSRIQVSDEVANLVITVPVVTNAQTEQVVNGDTSETSPETTEADTETTPPGQVVGVVGAVVRIEQLEQAVLPLARGDTEIAVIRSNNETLVATAGIKLQSESFIASELVVLDQARNGASGTFDTSVVDNEQMVGVYQPLVFENFTWATIVANPAPDTFLEGLWFEGVLVIVLAGVVMLAIAFVLGELTARPVRELAAKARALSQGDFVPVPISTGTHEVHELFDSLDLISTQLQSHSTEQSETQRIRLTQTRQMRDLLRRTLRLQEDEQRRIASEIHDAVSPLITGALYQARALELGNGSTPPEERAASLKSVNSLLERATEELHGVIFDLRPPDLDDLGVVAAIQAYASSQQRSSLNLHLELGEEPPGLTSEVRLGLYRITQEALHNVMRHAGADEALIRIESTDDMLRLTIRDNGSGFDPETAIRPTSLGLLSMRERAAAIGANLTVVSRPGGGAAIIVERTHTGSVMSDDVLANLISIESQRHGESRLDEEPATEDGNTVHNDQGNIAPVEGAPSS